MQLFFFPLLLVISIIATSAFAADKASVSVMKKAQFYFCDFGATAGFHRAFEKNWNYMFINGNVLTTLDSENLEIEGNYSTNKNQITWLLNRDNNLEYVLDTNTMSLKSTMLTGRYGPSHGYYSCKKIDNSIATIPELTPNLVAPSKVKAAHPQNEWAPGGNSIAEWEAKCKRYGDAVSACSTANQERSCIWDRLPKQDQSTLVEMNCNRNGTVNRTMLGH